MAHRLHRVAVPDGVVLLAQCTHALHVEQVTNFVVAVHQRHQRSPFRPVFEQRVEVVVVNAALLVYLHQIKLNLTPFRQIFQRVQHGMVFNRRGDGVDQAVGVDAAEDSRVVRLGAARREENFRRGRAQQLGHRFARPLNGRPHHAPVPVNGRRIAKIFPHQGQHDVQHGGVKLGRGGIIEINALHRS